MPSTYTLIASNTLSSSAASVTFSSIPNTFTDLVLKVSARGTVAGTVSFIIRPNSSSASEYSRTALFGTGSSAGSFRNSNSGALLAYANPSDSTASTFSSIEFYFANYTASTTKPISSIVMMENNATAAEMYVLAQLWNNTTAISSLLIDASGSGGNFASGSSFFLYGIKNS
jgi:hypothetical protein